MYLDPQHCFVAYKVFVCRKTATKANCLTKSATTVFVRNHQVLLVLRASFPALPHTLQHLPHVVHLQVVGLEGEVDARPVDGHRVVGHLLYSGCGHLFKIFTSSVRYRKGVVHKN